MGSLVVPLDRRPGRRPFAHGAGHGRKGVGLQPQTEWNYQRKHFDGIVPVDVTVE